MAKRKNEVEKPAEKIYPRKRVQVCAGKTEEEGRRNYARRMTSPEFAAIRVVLAVDRKNPIGEGADISTLWAQLEDHAAAVNRGDMERAESMLMGQATALQSLFVHLAERGMELDYVPGFEANMRMALRAQNQCRMTLETLAAIKNPPVVFSKQTNIAHGHQQVNNGTPSVPRTHAREEKAIPSNELLTEGDQHGPTLDSGGAAPASSDDLHLETVGEIHRPAKRRRESPIGGERAQARDVHS